MNSKDLFDFDLKNSFCEDNRLGYVVTSMTAKLVWGSPHFEKKINTFLMQKVIMMIMMVPICNAQKNSMNSKFVVKNFRYLIYSLVSFWLAWKMWVYVMFSVRSASQVIVQCGKIKTLQCDKREILHAGTPHWALSVHTTFSDLDHVSLSQQCQTVLTETCMCLSD